MKPIVWTRSSCVIGGKATVARENYNYILCVSGRGKTHKLTKTRYPINCFRIRVYAHKYNMFIIKLEPEINS